MSQSLDRGLVVLGHLAEKRMSLTEVSEILAVHKSTALRLLRVLEDNDMVRHNAEHIYRLGPAIFSMGANYLGGLDIRSIASTHLRKLAEETRLTVHLGAFDGSEVIYIDKSESAGTVRMYSSIGGSAPLHCTSVAKAILAHQPKKVLDGLLKDVEFTKHTESTITNAVDLMRELELTRERGYSVDNREHEDFVHCVGVPIRTSSHEVRFSLSLTAPVFTTSWEELTSYIPRLQEVAREIATELS